MINEGWIVVYIDDILIFSTDTLEHQQWTQQVLQWLKNNNFYFKMEKCKFDASEVEYLGLVV